MCQRFFSILLLFAVLCTAGCQKKPQVSAETQAENAAVTIAMGPTSEPESGFDPAYGWGCGEHVHEPLIQSTLTVTNKDLSIGNDLATEITQSADGLLWTVKIRQDAYFTDGEQLKAADVAFTYNNVKKLSTVTDFTMLDYAEASDDSTVRFHMNSPYAPWPYTMAAVGIVPEHGYDSAYGENPVGSGRYILKQWDRGQQVILEANPDYYGDPPLMQKVVVVFLDEDAAYAAARAGAVDVAYTAPSYPVDSMPYHTLLSVESVDNRGLNLPAIASDGKGIGNDVTADLAIRQAINIGIDREALIEHVLNGHGAPAYSVCDKMPWFNEAAIVECDVQEAKRILDKGGWITGEDGVRAKDGLRAQINILYPAGDSLRQSLAAETANQLNAYLGFAVTTEGVGWDTAYDRAQAEVMTWGWGAHSPMELYNIYHTAPGGDLAAYSPYANPAVDSYMDQALQSSSLEDANALWKMAQFDGADGIIRDVPWVWLANINHLYWVRTGLAVAPQKIHPHGHGWSIANNVDQWHWTDTE